MLKCAWLFALASICAATAQAATTRYVAPTGSDTNPGTETAPYKTVRKGLVTTLAGDTLILRGGTYVENLGGPSPVSIRPGTATAPITFKAYPGERPVIQGLLWLSRPSYWKIDGINVTWNPANTDTTKHMVKIVNGIGWVVVNCEFWGAHSFAGLLVAGTVTGEPANWYVGYNSIHDTYKSNNTNQDHCIYCNTGLTAGSGLIERNLLYNALNGEGIKIGGANSSQGSVHVTARYNTVYNCAQNLMISWMSNNNLLYRNLLVKSASTYWVIRGYQLRGINNTAQENAGFLSKGIILNDSGYQAIKLINNVFPVDPKFDSVTAGGFHPQNSAAQGYGRYAPATP